MNFQKNKGCFIGIGAVVLVIVILVIWLASGYNGMYKEKQTVDEAWANVESQYQRRKDLIPNIENTVAAFAKHEETTLTSVIKARNNAEKAQAVADALPQGAPADNQEFDRYMNAQNEASRALNLYVNAVKEAYPQLTSQQNFMDLQSQLEGTENRIQVAREGYNAAVKKYNEKVRSFPNVLISGMFGFPEKAMFRADADAAVAPTVFEND